jgi:hypothetical protein
MRPSVAAPLAVAAVAALVAVGGPAHPAVAEPSQSQAIFTKSLLDDPATSAGVKRLLRTHAGIVDPRSGFLDATGDGRQDALILVSTTGAAGTVAVYLFSTHGQPADETRLKVVFRLQSLYRALVRVNGATLSILEPRWRPGDDLCCPRTLRERDYRFDARTTTFRRVADHDVATEAPAG